MSSFQVCRESISLALVLSLIFFLCPLPSFSAEPGLQLLIEPNSTEIPVGAEKVTLTALADGTDLTYQWSLSGPGTIEGTDLSGAAQNISYYIPPDSIDGVSQSAVVKVTVIAANGQEKTETLMFTIISNSVGANQGSVENGEVTNGKADEKQGMSTGTKVAIGVGAAAVIGGIAALASSGGDGDDGGGPFSGTFRRSWTGETERGNTNNNVDTLQLKQSGNVISGTFTWASTLPNCCTASYTVGLNATANGLEAVFNWPGGQASCQCAETTYTISDGAVTNAHAILVNNTTLQFEGGAVVVRQSLIDRNGEVEDHIQSRDRGVFTRQ